MKYKIERIRVEENSFDIPDGSQILKAKYKGSLSKLDDHGEEVVLEPGGFYITYAEPINVEDDYDCPVVRLSNGKIVYIQGKGISRDEAHELIIALINTWGTDFQKQELRDKALTCGR